MNLIGNNCGSSFILKKMGKEFNNPFVWCSIPPKDMIALIKDYNTIDFNNIKIISMDKNLYPKNELIQSKLSENKIYGVKIDNKIKVYFTHYLNGDSIEPIKDGIDIFIKDNEKFVKEKYLDRLTRNGIKEKPIFYIIPYSFNEWTDEDVVTLCNLDMPYRIILIYPRIIEHKPNVNIIISDINDGNAERITERNFNEIYKMLS